MGGLPSGDAPPPGLLQRLRESIRYQHYSLRTENAYVHWVRAFVRFHRMRHPRTIGADEVQAFLSWLAVERRVSVSTTMVYTHVLEVAGGHVKSPLDRLHAA